jgi:polyphenol oxidase
MNLPNLRENYAIADRLMNQGILAATTFRLRSGRLFNMSRSSASCRGQYWENLSEWIADWNLMNSYRADRIFFLHQTHSSNILNVDASALSNNDSTKFVQNCDGLITRIHEEPDVVLTVKTADCVPLFLFDPRTRARGIVHCGWRGLWKQIVVLAIKRMRAELDVDPSTLLMHIGPCIMSSNYEVGADVAALFPHQIEERGRQTFLDLGRS